MGDGRGTDGFFVVFFEGKDSVFLLLRDVLSMVFRMEKGIIIEKDINQQLGIAGCLLKK